jgi:alpha-L-arabinofuranosidase
MKAKITLHKDFVIGQIDPKLYGSFVEHLGRCIYGGIYEPGHPAADARGFRRDVLEVVREARIPLLRYPGGNYTAGYDWKDSVGPVGKRPVRPDLAWLSLEPNTFGLAEFVEWTRELPADVLMTLNMGTQAVPDALALLEYCNFRGGSQWSDLRRSHGRKEPYDFTLWCLGNEVDGPWQVAQKSAAEYARLANETAKAMKLLDPRVQLSLCGSSFKRMPTFPEWDRTVLELCYDNVDFLSLHTYLRNFQKDRATYLAESIEMEDFIVLTLGICDLVKDRRMSRKRVDISFDEWNVWPRAQESDRFIDPWRFAPPLLEETSTMEDALVFGCMMNVLIRHADRVRMACMSLLVNALSPIMTATGGPVWRQATFYPFKYATLHGTGQSLRPAVQCPTYENATYGTVPFIDASATLDAEKGEVTLFVVNRHETDSAQLDLLAAGFGRLQCIEHVILESLDPMAANTMEKPLTVAPRVAAGPAVENESLQATLPPFSWNMLRLRSEG